MPVTQVGLLYLWTAAVTVVCLCLGVLISIARKQ